MKASGILIFMMLALGSSTLCIGQQELVLENTKNGKRIDLREGDNVRVIFRADSVLSNRYRPLSYRKKDKRIAYAKGELMTYTAEGFLLKTTRGFPASLFAKKTDTLIIALDQVHFVNKYSKVVMTSTSVITRVLLRGGIVFASIELDIPTYSLIGMNILSLFAEPYPRKWIQNMLMPLKKTQGSRANWTLYYRGKHIEDHFRITEPAPN